MMHEAAKAGSTNNELNCLNGNNGDKHSSEIKPANSTIVGDCEDKQFQPEQLGGRTMTTCNDAVLTVGGSVVEMISSPLTTQKSNDSLESVETSVETPVRPTLVDQDGEVTPRSGIVDLSSCFNNFKFALLYSLFLITYV